MDKADGVPLFVEEMTKAVLESGLLKATNDHYELTGPVPALAIPATLHDSLMARLDRLGAAKGVAQLGATIGRQQFATRYSRRCRHGQGHVAVRAGAVSGGRVGVPAGCASQATYTFKHALIQDTAYQSLLKSTGSSTTSKLRR